MRIASKLNSVMLTVFIATALINYIVLQKTIKPHFDGIENSLALVNHKRITDALDSAAQKVSAGAQDWGFWTDAYNYAKGEDRQAFEEANLQPAVDVVSALHLNAMVFRAPDGSMIWGEAFNLIDKSPIDGLAQEIAGLGYRHPYLDGVGEPTAKVGLLRTSQGLALAAVSIIMRTDRSGPPAGTIIAATLLDVAALKSLTGVEFSFEEIPPTGTALTKVPVLTTLKDTMVTASLIPHLDGSPLALLYASTPRDISKAGTSAIQSAIWSMLAAAAAVLAVLWMFMRIIVVSRIEALKNHFATASSGGRLCATDHEKSSDEIGGLAKSFNQLADEVNALRDTIAENAYLNGMSEWAAGTLHNVRNGLSPINLNALMIHDLFNAPWQRNVKSAVDELRFGATSAERGEKLSAYIISKAPLMVENADHARTISGEIELASKALEEIVAEYERFSRHETECEEVDLRDMIEGLVRTDVNSRDPQVVCHVAEDGAVAAANRTILRQILVNIFKNAVEAMNGQAREKHIDVQFKQSSPPDGNVAILISDTGQGIAPENLKTIFERGFSTRPDGTGGLGLHWCANASRSMGGSLYAESNGTGAGATFVLTLPVSINSLKDAA